MPKPKCDFNIKLQSNFIEITFRHESCPINLLHIFRTPFHKNNSEGLLILLLILFMSMLKKLNSIKYNVIVYTGSSLCAEKRILYSVFQNIAC